MRHLKPGTEEQQVAELTEVLGGSEYVVCSDEYRGRQVACVVPFGTNRGIRLWWKIMRMMARATWRELA